MKDTIFATASLDVAFPTGSGLVQLTEAQIAAVAGGCDCGCEHSGSDGPPGGAGDKNG